ncbi:hypothetical protein BDQ17DRAFT_1334870 [Cyathus striatus]|nr:hypothetical protein BDQ17DRAFT_1334870 [Cyathus striatus]
MILPTLLLAISWLHLSFITTAEAVLVNVTVDDSLPDPLTGRPITYLPTDAWKDGVLCTDCTATVDGGSMFDRTWHDGTYFPANSNLPPTGPLNATFSFNGEIILSAFYFRLLMSSRYIGTAIYVFCAISLSITSPTGYSNMTFYIDNELVGQFERVPPGFQGAYQYNVSVYSNTTLPAGEHAFMLQNGQFGNVGNKSLTLFDYLVYSFNFQFSFGHTDTYLVIQFIHCAKGIFTSWCYCRRRDWRNCWNSDLMPTNMVPQA